MATSSRFNRPYGPSAQGQAPWERINRPDRQLGDQSLANQAATPSGRGYYDPERILERVARGRPGTSMQQAVAAMELAGIQESRALAGQQDQPPAPPPLPAQAPAARGSAPAAPTAATPGPWGSGYVLPAEPTKTPGPWGSGYTFETTPNKKKSPVEDYMSKFKINDPAKFKLFGTGT